MMKSNEQPILTGPSGAAGPADGGNQRIVSFAPLVDHRSTVLVLGTMPGVASLQKQQYYGHPQNAFWRIVFDLWSTPLAADYQQRCQFLLGHHVALWDVLHACERNGSADAAIRQAIAHDFVDFLNAWPQIRQVFFNGHAAASLMYRLVLHPLGLRAMDGLRAGLTACELPSTSPAHTLGYEAKLAAWHVVRETADHPG